MKDQVVRVPVRRGQHARRRRSRRPRAGRIRLLVRITLLSAAVAAGSAACGAGASGPATAPVSTSRAPTRVGRPSAAATTASAAVTPTLPADRTAAALAAYRRFWDVAQTLDRRPAAEWRAVLSQVSAEPVLSRVLAGFESRVRAGYRQFGTVITRPVVVESGAAAVAVLDCQDASGTGEIDTATGLPTNVGRARTPVAATVTRGADGRWRVSDARYLDGTC